MKVLESDPNHVIAMEIYDGPAVMYGKTTFEAINANQTKITTIIDIPWMDENADKTFFEQPIGTSLSDQKAINGI